MPSNQRLRTSRDILATLRSRSQRVGTFAVTHVRVVSTSGEHVPARVAVVASKKVGSAVARNRSKRLLREAARQLAWTPGTDVVLVARRSTATAHLDLVAREVREHAASLDVLRPESAV